MSDSRQDILFKSWETQQALIQRMSENCWQTRTVLYTAVFALITVAYTTQERSLYLLTLGVPALFFLFEAGYRVREHEFIARSQEIEKAITDILVEQASPRLPLAIGTAVEKISWRSIRGVLGRHRFLFWGPYLALISVLLLCYFANITAKKEQKKEDKPLVVVLPCAASARPEQATRTSPFSTDAPVDVKPADASPATGTPVRPAASAISVPAATTPQPSP